MKLVRENQQWLDSDCMFVFDHFTNKNTTLYSTLATDSGTVAVGDTAGGVILFTPSDGTVADNDECGLYTTAELFLASANRPITGKCRIKYAEANTNAANVFFGFASAFGANLLVDDGAGPRTSGNVIGIYKVDGGTVWRCVTRYGSTTSVTDTVSDKTAGGTAWQTLEIVMTDQGSNIQVTFLVDGQNLKDSSGNLIIHQFPVASATEMNFGAYVKNGSTTLETVSIDKWYAGTLQAA